MNIHRRLEKLEQEAERQEPAPCPLLDIPLEHFDAVVKEIHKRGLMDDDKEKLLQECRKVLERYAQDGSR